MLGWCTAAGDVVAVWRRSVVEMYILEHAHVDEVGEVDVGKLVEEEAVSVEAVMMIAVAVD
jgi:hypothetical protein